MTLFAVHSAVACVTHSRAWMPASSQMAGLSPPPPVLNCNTSRHSSGIEMETASRSGPLPGLLLGPLSVLHRIKRTRGDRQVILALQFVWSLSFNKSLNGD